MTERNQNAQIHLVAISSECTQYYFKEGITWSDMSSGTLHAVIRQGRLLSSM